MIDISKDLLSSIDPMRKINEDMQRALNPMYDIQKSMSLATLNIGDTYSLHSQSVQEFAKQLEAITNPLDSLQKKMEMMYDPMKEIQKQMDFLISPTNSLIKQANMIQKTAQAFQKSMASLGFESFVSSSNIALENKRYKRLIDTLTVSMNESIATMNLNDLVDSIKKREDEYNNIIASSTNREVHSTTIVSQFDIVQSNLINDLEKKHTTLEAKIEEIQALIIAQKDPFLLSIFMYVILPLLVNFIFEFEIKPAIEPFFKSSVPPSVLKKEIKKNVYEYILDPEMRQRVRFVTASTLNLREGNSKKTKIIGSLYLGELVELIKKEKNWCYVRRYNAESETYMEGWVFTRYLANVR